MRLHHLFLNELKLEIDATWIEEVTMGRRGNACGETKKCTLQNCVMVLGTGKVLIEKFILARLLRNPKVCYCEGHH
jgi:hypothetical protein